MIVVDASAILELLLGSSAAVQVDERIFQPNETLHAPHILDIEVAQVLRRYCRTGELTEARGQEALSDLADLPLQRYPHWLFFYRIWELRDTLTAYDAVYVALAEALSAPLLTCDRKLAAAPRHNAKIEVV